MYARILVPVDGSSTAERGLAEAIRLAAATKGRLVVMTAAAGFVGAMEQASVRSYDESFGEILKECSARLDRAATRVAEAGVECDTVVVDCRGRSVARTILDELATWKCDLVVMGTHGRRGLTRLVLGSDAEAVLRGSSVPVLLVREGGAA